MRVVSGQIDHREALGLSQELRQRGYGLLCVARATGPLEVETQDEDEVYELQFGRHFNRGQVGKTAFHFWVAERRTFVHKPD